MSSRRTSSWRPSPAAARGRRATMATSTASVRAGGTGAGAALEWVRERGVYVVFAALVLFNVLYTPNYATKGTLTGTLIQVTPVLLVSLGLTLVIATGGIDISIGAVMAIASAIVPLYLGWSWPVAVLLALIVCTLAGGGHGTPLAVRGGEPHRGPPALV